MVEDLLRRLPGLQIGLDGSITYNGEKIQHLLVDGEDIFGSDPTLITRNFDASKIARIQILDRKSDQALFTGVDDGKRTKTLNLVLKGSAKEGYFGKGEIGKSADGYYNSNATLAAFRNNQQIVGLGLASNTGVLGVSSNVGGATSSISFINWISDALGASAGTGIPSFRAVALHYANKWGTKNEHLIGDFQYGHYASNPVTSTISLQAQDGKSYKQDESKKSTNQQDQNFGRARCEFSPKKGFNLQFGFQAKRSSGTNTFGDLGEGYFNDTLINSNQRSINDRVSRTDLSINSLGRIQIGKKPTRGVSISLALGGTGNVTTGYLYSLSRFYSNSGIVQIIDSINQEKYIENNSTTTSMGLSYTEPIGKSTILGAIFGISSIYSDPIQNTFAFNDGKYNVLVDSLTSRLQSNTTNRTSALSLEGKAGNLSYSIGSSLIWYNFLEQDHLKDSSRSISYTSFAPRILLRYSPKTNTSFRLEYNSSVLQPTAAQLQPLTNNSDPLNITIGNPNLQPGINRNFSFEFQRINKWITNLTLNLSLLQNTISTKTVTDSLGRQINLPMNVDGSKSGWMNFSLSGRFAGFDVSFRSALNYIRTVNFVNLDLNRNDILSGGIGFTLTKYAANKYNLQLNADIANFNEVSSINTLSNIHYWSRSASGLIVLYFLRPFDIGSSASYNWQEKTSAFTLNTSTFLINSYISRNFLHDNLVLKVQMNNILNENSGINRTSINNVNTESRTNILGRYLMLSMTYHFDKKFKQK